MERKLGEIFTCGGDELVVAKSVSFCRGCYFHGKQKKRKPLCYINSISGVLGKCTVGRTDGMRVIFKKA